LIDIIHLDHGSPAVARQIVEVQQAGYRVEAQLTGYDGMPGLTQDADAVAALDETLLGASEDEHLLGVLGYTRHGDQVDVSRLVVHPHHFRKGIGTLLLRELHAREQDARRVEVTTSTGNTPATALYLREGYVIVDRDDTGPVPVSHFARTPPREDDLLG
jgi:GNAT superfamily N-acetyltransferase